MGLGEGSLKNTKANSALRGDGGSIKKITREKGSHVKYFGNTLSWDMFYYSQKNISLQKQTKKVLKSATDYNFKATELNEQKKVPFLYLLNFHLYIIVEFLNHF